MELAEDVAGVYKDWLHEQLHRRRLQPSVFPQALRHRRNGTRTPQPDGRAPITDAELTEPYARFLLADDLAEDVLAEAEAIKAPGRTKGLQRAKIEAPRSPLLAGVHTS